MKKVEMKSQQFILDKFGFELNQDMGGTFFEKEIAETKWMTLSGCPNSDEGMEHVVGSPASDVRLEIEDDGGRTLRSWILSEELGVDEHAVTTEEMVNNFLMRFVEDSK